MIKKALKAAFPLTLPVFMGYLFLGIAFGVLLSSKGFHAGWAVFMSVLIYAGSMQFVAVPLLVQPFNLLTTVFLTLTVNARHLFYGLSMLDKFKDTGKAKPYLVFSLTDETYSLLCSASPAGKCQPEVVLLFYRGPGSPLLDPGKRCGMRGREPDPL